jgi:hypothetical protein
MENDQQDANQGQGRLQTENLDATGELPANNNGHETAEPRQEIAAESSGKRTVSSRKIAANRQNASKSTGPRTQTGKRMVAKNALKHGFFSKCLLIPHPDGKEDSNEYQNLYAALRVTIHFGRVGGVVLSKVIAVLLMLGVRRRLWMVNLVYVGVICWNVVVVVALAVHRH